jgi:nucleoid-associated protein YgaU
MMRWLARALAALVIACGLVPLTAGASWACSCLASPLTESQEWRAVAAQSRDIYLAEVVGRTGGRTISPDGVISAGEYRYRLRVVTSLKGNVSGTRYVTTNTESGTCGATVDEDRPLLVFGEVLYSCGRTGFTQERVAQRAAIIRAALLEQSAGTVHVVRRGEWLWRIARVELARQGLGNRNPSVLRRYVAAIYVRNHDVIGQNPNHLRVGTRLILPPAR